ncbi:hypothetical protein SMD44_p10169 (plasmid) [Streptomyces alboflavus]|uniref:Uncharacterized protein n=1 Tax=Streptomyces alboflavus TaxID=67267 RepID=A0A291W3S9_9ACTN|nr:hypothetical protein [Streptomyces alboflavus]ATM24668.1 hypothetical protein SMD44_p10169 [Streptomyces alboflavus]
MTEPVPSVAEQTAHAVAAAYPGLHQSAPYSIGKPLSAVQLAPDLTARYSWGPYEVHVKVGPGGHRNTDDPEDTSLQRQVQAHATLLVTEISRAEEAQVRGHVEWPMYAHNPQIMFPAAHNAAAENLKDPRLASAVLATVAQALDFTQLATRLAAHKADAAAQEAQWRRECPTGMSVSQWLRRKRAEQADSGPAQSAEPGRRADPQAGHDDAAGEPQQP